MPTKVRKQVYIEPRHEQTLKRLSRLPGVTEAEIIHRARPCSRSAHLAAGGPA